MKSFGTYTPPETVGLEFVRLAAPHGATLPRAPVAGELYTLERDMPEPINGTPWYTRGTYVFNGVAWNRLNDSSRERKAAPIGSRTVEIERAGELGSVPRSTAGCMLTSVALTPSNQRASFSGTASMWLDISKRGHVWLMVFRGNKLVGLALEYMEPNRPRTVSVSFVDSPATLEQQVYTLRLDSDITPDSPEVPGYVHVNQAQSKFRLDGMSQTAFIVAENN